MRAYARDIWTSRYFWWHLAKAEIRARFRRSRLGILWALLHPLLLTIMIALVLGAVFRSPSREFAPFVFSGILVWGFICESVQTGCASLISAGPYIKQCALPAAIYPLRYVLSSFLVFCVGLAGFAVWALVLRPQHFNVPLLSLALSLPLLILLGWPLSVIAGFVNAKFRDFQYLVALLLQAVWYVSPVFIEPRLFRAVDLGFLVDYNPVTHILNLVRAPLLDGAFPSAADYAYTIGTILVFSAIALRKIAREEANIIFYL
ncbi:MAG: ABC transporter permease [Planctomycetota bacterium]